jgi:hypothetical protein
MNRTEQAMNALDTVMDAGQKIVTEAIERRADLKQGRLASEACGRVIAATKASLEYRLAAPKLAEIEAKNIDAPKLAEIEAKNIDAQKAAADELARSSS